MDVVGERPGSGEALVNSALLEAGLVYSVAKMAGTTVKAYVRDGAEMWGGSRGTQWRASEGVPPPVLIAIQQVQALSLS